jgi:hypothetical protein
MLQGVGWRAGFINIPLEKNEAGGGIYKKTHNNTLLITLIFDTLDQHIQLRECAGCRIQQYFKMKFSG